MKHRCGVHDARDGIEFSVADPDLGPDWVLRT